MQKNIFVQKNYQCSSFMRFVLQTFYRMRYEQIYLFINVLYDMRMILDPIGRLMMLNLLEGDIYREEGRGSMNLKIHQMEITIVKTKKT